MLSRLALLVVVAALSALVPAQANAQLTIAVGDVINRGDIATGGTHNGLTCSCGGFYLDYDPLLAGVDHFDRCFPCNTGPQGPQGVAGATGATGATGPQGPAGTDGVDADAFAFLDDNGFAVADLYAIGSQPYYWDGNAFWPLTAETGGIGPVFDVGQLFYADSSCATTPFYTWMNANIVALGTRGNGSQAYWRVGAARSVPGTCYAWNGSSCASSACPATPVVNAMVISQPGVIGTWDAPLRLVLQ